MGLLAKEVEELKKAKKPKKWEILKECCEDDINEMIKLGVPLRKQIEIILNAGVLEKLDLKEYHYILKKHFGYTGKKEKIRVFEVSEEAQSDLKESKKNKPKVKATVSKEDNTKNKRESASDLLKKDFNIMNVAGYDFDNLE